MSRSAYSGRRRARDSVNPYRSGIAKSRHAHRRERGQSAPNLSFRRRPGYQPPPPPCHFWRKTAPYDCARRYGPRYTLGVVPPPPQAEVQWTGDQHPKCVSDALANPGEPSISAKLHKNPVTSKRLNDQCLNLSDSHQTLPTLLSSNGPAQEGLFLRSHSGARGSSLPARGRAGTPRKSR